MVRQLTLYTLRRFSLKADPERVLLPEEFYIVETWQDFLSSHPLSCNSYISFLSMDV